MERKNIWINCLIIGISLILIISCDTHDYITRISYQYENKTNHKIDMVLEGEIYTQSHPYRVESPAIFNIAQNDSFIMKFRGGDNEKPADKPSNTIKYNPILGDSVKIIFDSVRYISFKKDTQGIDQIYDEENYDYERLGDLEFKFTYSFTEQDYENAMPLE